MMMIIFIIRCILQYLSESKLLSSNATTAHIYISSPVSFWSVRPRPLTHSHFIRHFVWRCQMLLGCNRLRRPSKGALWESCASCRIITRLQVSSTSTKVIIVLRAKCNIKKKRLNIQKVLLKMLVLKITQRVNHSEWSNNPTLDFRWSRGSSSRWIPARTTPQIS